MTGGSLVRSRVTTTVGRFLASAVLLLTIALPTRAAGEARPDGASEGWEIGAGVLFGNYKLDGGAIDDGAAGFKAWGQYRFNQYFGLELGFLDSGEFDEDTTPGEADGNATLSVNGFTLGVLGYLPFSPEAIQIFGKVGYYTLNQDLEFNGDIGPARNADGLTAGVGADIALVRQLTVRVEGDWYDLKRDANLWTVGLGLGYHFGGP